MESLEQRTVPSFLTATTFETGPNNPPSKAGRGAYGTVTGDFDKDGLMDIASIDVSDPTQIDVIVPNGDGTFKPPVGYSTGGTGVFSLVVADFNGDGNLDIGATDGSNLIVLPGRGDGTFGAPIITPEGVGGSIGDELAAGDFTGDKIPDIVSIAAAPGSGNTFVIQVAPGKGDGTFGPLITGSAPADISFDHFTVADFNRDGKLDLAATPFSGGSTTLDVFFGNGDGTFQPPMPLQVGSRPLYVTSGDLNGDGKPDLVVVRWTSNPSETSFFPDAVQIFLSNGDGTFAQPIGVDPGVTAGQPSIADLNGDGKPDLILAGASGTEFSTHFLVMLGNGDGTFLPANGYVVHDLPWNLVVGNFTNSKHLDIVTTSDISNLATFARGNGDGTFQASRSYRAEPMPSQVAESGAWGLVAADLTGNGHVDLVGAGEPGNAPMTVAALLGNGDGTFQIPTTNYVGTSADIYGAEVRVGDLNGDGHPDVVANTLLGEYMVLLGKGDGTFAPPQIYFPPQYSASCFALGDFNGDGKLDIAFGQQGNSPSLPGGGTDSTVFILPGNGDGTFGAPVPYSTGVLGGQASSMIAADLNGDGKLDLILTEGQNNRFAGRQGPDYVTVLMGNGDGTFQPAVNYATGGDPAYLAVGDLTGKGHLDIVTANLGTDGVFSKPESMSVLLNNGDGTFRSLGDQQLDGLPTSVAIADFNGDGNADVALSLSGPVSTSSLGPQGILLLPGNGDGTFQSGIFYFAGAGARAIAAADFNGDGLPDIAVATADDQGRVTVLLNQPEGLQFNISAPTSVTAGTPFQITVTAANKYGRTYQGYQGRIRFTSTDGTALLPADATLTKGQGTFTVTLKTAGTQSLTITDTAQASVQGSMTTTVAAAAASRFIVSAPANITAGTTATLTVNAVDAFNNLATNYAGTVHFSSTDPSAILPADSLLTNGIGTFSFTPHTAGSQVLTAADTVQTALSGSSGLTVSSGPVDHLSIVASSSFPLRTPVQVTVNALDAFKNLASTYTGPIHFTSSDTAAVLPGDYTFTGGDTGSHTFTVTWQTIGNQSLTVADTSNPSLSATLTNLAVTDSPSQHNQRFVQQLYRNLLGREADASGLAAFTTVLNQNQATRGQVVQAILDSTEYRTNSIEALYRQLLGRAADSTGLAAWSSFLSQGGTQEQLEAFIIGSDEYYARRGGNNPTGFLAAIYADGLGRGVDATGAQAWGAMLASGTPRSAVAAAVLTSLEADQDRVAGWFVTFLHRKVDPYGLNAFAAAMEQGARDEQVLIGILASDEYFGRQ